MKTQLWLLVILLLGVGLLASPALAAVSFGPLLPQDVLLSSSVSAGDSAVVAFGGENYLVVWPQVGDGGDMDIYGRLLSKSGALLTDPFPIVTKPGVQRSPAVAFNGLHYLVVWHDNMGSAPWDTINGRAVSLSGVPLGDEQIISQATTNTRFYPAVASNGTDFFVVWQENSNYATSYSDIHGRQVGIDGAGNAIPGSLTWQNERPGYQFFPSVAFGGGKYLVTWSEDVTPSTNEYDVLALLVDPLTLTSGSLIAISTAPSWQGSRPAGIAYGSGQFLVVFDDHRAGGYGAVYGARVSKNGLLLDGPPESGGITIAINAGTGGPHAPQVAFANGEWLVAWGGSEARGARVNGKGEVLDPQGIALARTTSDQFAPALATDGQNYLLTWQHIPTFNKYAQLIGYTLSGDLIHVNSTADPGDGFCTPQECTLREALRVANGQSAPTTIYLPAGTITLAAPGREEDAGVTGDLDITANVTLMGRGADVTILDAASLDRVLHVLPGATVTLAQLTLRNGLAGDGGGILNEGALTLKHCRVSDNNVSYDSPDGEDLGSNTAGGILNLGSLTILRSEISHNRTNQSYGDGVGGGILNEGTLQITNSALHHNWAAGGSGIYNRSGRVTLTATTLQDNDVRFFGGALSNRAAGVMTLTRSVVHNNGESIYNEGSLTITDSSITANRGYRVAGGIWNTGVLQVSGSLFAYNSGHGGLMGVALSNRGTAVVRNTTFSDNGGSGYDIAAGVISNYGSLSLIHCTISDNGITTAALVSASGSLMLTNTLVAANSPANCTGPLQSGGYNLDSDGSCLLQGVGDMQADPLLGPLQANGGPTLTRLLLPGSPAIDHIPRHACTTTVDQRGFMRPVDGNGDGIVACDSGAVEVLPIP